MVVLSNVIELQLIIFIIIAVGLVLTKMKIITTSGRKCMTDLLINFILPCNILYSFMIKVSKDIWIATIKVLTMAIGIQIVCWILGKIIYVFVSESKRKVLQYATMCSNAGFMGNPIIEGIYGSQGLLYASVYLIPLRIFMWSAGLSCFTKTSIKDTIKKLAVHPCIIAVWIGFFMIITQVVLPQFLTKSIQYVSNCNLAVSMLVVGSILAQADFKTIVSKISLYFCIIRLLLIPIITLLICRMLHFDGLVTGVCVILSGMPAGSTTAILAEKYGGDAEYASKCVVLSTLLSLITIPILCLLMQV